MLSDRFKIKSKTPIAASYFITSLHYICIIDQETGVKTYFYSSHVYVTMLTNTAYTNLLSVQQQTEHWWSDYFTKF